jgi:uncharacterized GH25 family protein
MSAVIASHAAAHDLVFHPGAQPDAPLVARYGHPGDWQPIEATKLLEVGVARGRALVPAATISPVDGRLDIAWDRDGSGGGLVAARYDNGFWTQRGDGTWVNARRTAIPEAKAALSSFKFAKAWTGSRGTPGYDATVGHRLELSLLDDPATLAPGGTARVQVLWQGQPMAGAQVEIGDGATAREEADIPRFAADNEGVATVPIAAWGLQVLGVDHETDPAIPALADHDKFVATYSFFLKR